MTCRLRAIETLNHSGPCPWIYQTVDTPDFPAFHDRWYRDFLVETLVVGHWIPGHHMLPGAELYDPGLAQRYSQP